MLCTVQDRRILVTAKFDIRFDTACVDPVLCPIRKRRWIRPAHCSRVHMLNTTFSTLEDCCVQSGGIGIVMAMRAHAF